MISNEKESELDDSYDVEGDTIKLELNKII